MLSLRRLIVSSLAGVSLSIAVAGCQPERPDVIPSSAQMTVSGRTMHFTAPNDGMVYVYDKPAQRLLWSGAVVSGQAVDVDPQKNQIMLGGSVVANKIPNPNDETDLYFDRAPMPLPMQNQPINTTPGYTGGVTVTPNATVQPASGTVPAGTVTVQPGLSVSPAAQPAQNPQR